MSNNITVTISNQPLMDKITQLQQEIITLEETVTSLNAQIADLNRQIEQKQATIDSLNTQISQLQEQISQLDAQVTALTEQVQTLILENSQLTQQVESLTTENTQLTQQVESLTTENSRLTEQVQSLTSQVSQLTEQVQQLQASVESLNGQITSMTNQINTINGETVQNPIEYLAQTKSDILTALQGKGSSATSSTTFRNYANEISLLNPKGDIHTKLLLRFSEANTYGDVSMFNAPITYSSGFTRSSSIKKFGSYSFEATNTSEVSISYCQQIPMWDYTIEFWLNATALNDQHARSFVQILDGTNSVYVFGCYNGSSNMIFRNSAFTQSIHTSLITLNEWHHIVYSRQGMKAYAFLDGFLVETLSYNRVYPNIWSGSVIRLGGADMGHHSGNSIIYYCDEFRISDICRYTEDFTPPTEPFSI